eukprot:539257_1
MTIPMYLYKHHIEQINHRHLLNKDAFELESSENPNFDILNLHTYDEFDWIILVLCLITFACIFCCIGWCLHKLCVYNKIVGNAEADVETLEYQLSNTTRSTTVPKFLRQLSKLGSNIELSTRRFSKSAKSARNTPTITAKPRWHNNPTSADSDVKTPLSLEPNFQTLQLPQKMSKMQTIPSTQEVKHGRYSLSTGLANTGFVVVDDKGLKKQVSFKDIASATTPSIITTPATAGVKSPGSYLTSETHVSIQIATDYSESPYLQCVKSNGYNINLEAIVEFDNQNEQECTYKE